MASEQKTNYKALIITGVISLAVAVGGNILVNKLSEERLSLVYDLTASATFNSSGGNIKITNVSIANNGGKSIDDISLIIDLPEGNIEEFKLNGLPPNSYNIDQKPNKLILTAKYLNPNEEFFIQLLLNNPKKAEFLPFVDLRGRGTIGSQVVKEEKNSLLETIVTAIAALTTAMVFFSSKSIRKITLGSDIPIGIVGLGDKHSDEQRDVVAYVLSNNSLNSNADEIRNITRDISYWSICDLLTQKWVDSGDKELCRQGAKTLEDLVGYASINPGSLLLIQSNIARLYKEAGNESEAQKFIDEILKSNSGVIRARVSNIEISNNA